MNYEKLFTFIKFVAEVNSKETDIAIPKMAAQNDEILSKITSARIKLKGPYKSIKNGNKDAAALLEVMKRMNKLNALVFNPPNRDDNQTLAVLFLDLSELKDKIFSLHIQYYYRPKSDKWVLFSKYFPNVLYLELLTSNIACAFGFKKLINLTIRQEFFDEGQETVTYSDTWKLLEEIRDANNRTSVFLILHDKKEFVRYTQLLQIFQHHPLIRFSLSYYKSVVYRRQRMHQLTVKDMQIIDKEITGEQHVVLICLDFQVLMEFPETLDHVLFDYLYICIDDLRDEKRLIFLKKFLQIHKCIRRLQIAVPSIWGGLPLVWSVLFTQIKSIREFSIDNSIGGTSKIDSIHRVVSDDNSSTLVADIQSCKFYPLPLDNLIVLYLTGERDADNEQEYLEWFKMNPAGTDYRVIDGQGKTLYARDL